VAPADGPLADIHIRAPTRGNRRLDQLLAAVNGDLQVKAWWHMAGINAQRLGLTDHSWVHIQIVTNIGLRLARLLFRRGVTSSLVADHGLTERDAEVVIAAAALFHCVGMSIHRADHEQFSLFLTADKLPKLLEPIYDEPTRSIIVAEASHAIISHRSKGAPFTIEGAILRVADALDMAEGRSRIPFEKGRVSMHSLSAAAIDDVSIKDGESHPVMIEIVMNNSSGLFQVDGLLKAKLRGSGLEPYVEVVAHIDTETEQRLIQTYRLEL
jgi:metal-dependent HD superfamily phosphatase/phosphodiesterase